MDLFTIGLQDHRKDHSIGQTVGNIIFPAQGVGDGMYISHIRFGKSASGVEGSMQHIAACVYVAAVRVYGINIFKNQFDSQECVLAGPISGGVSDISLHGMCQCVHSGSGGDKRRQT